MSKSDEFPLKTKRMVIGHVLVCSGCCCGDVSRSKPPVPVDCLKEEWKKRGLLKNIQLSICGCLGPCDLTNVVKISNPDGECLARHYRRLPTIPESGGLGLREQEIRKAPAAAEGIRFPSFRPFSLSQSVYPPKLAAGRRAMASIIFLGKCQPRLYTHLGPVRCLGVCRGLHDRHFRGRATSFSKHPATPQAF
jgi:hypothetical protein